MKKPENHQTLLPNERYHSSVHHCIGCDDARRQHSSLIVCYRLQSVLDRWNHHDTYRMDPTTLSSTLLLDSAYSLMLWLCAVLFPSVQRHATTHHDTPRRQNNTNISTSPNQHPIRIVAVSTHKTNNRSTITDIFPSFSIPFRGPLLSSCSTSR
jgi:hypothetical protein